ncbi:MAG TPA: zincin-like metallopeptidase domain-containing protein [Terriglobales bacterium]|nr:zincin-like metallopeptidase domain-containing protein [Terriglobales bacterium]
MATTAQPPNSLAPKPEKRDFRQEVTDRIVNMLEDGVAPWQKPWEPGRASVGMPTNPTTDKTYRGGNAIHLMATGLRKDYEDPRWMTYKQAADQGWQVRKGEKGTQIEFWEVKPYTRQRDDQEQPEGGDERPGESKSRGSRLIHRVYTVFNAKQIDGIPAYKPKEYTPFEAAQAGEEILKNSGARISHDQADRAFYSRASDSIHLPPKDAFKDAAGYYGTALHELAHWTGHPARLNRQTLTESYRFGDTNYAKEELRAELASVFMAAERGIPHDPEQHAAYVGSWIKSLKEDKNEIFRAAHDASAATDFLLALERDRSIADQALEAGPETDAATAGSSRGAVLEEETSRLERDREDLAEEPAPVEAMRESSDFTSRYEPGSGTVNVHAKQNGTDRRTTVETMAPSDGLLGAAANEQSAKQPNDPKSLTAAQAITTKALGESARTVHALTESGTYQGPIIGETELHLIQRQSANLGVAHIKNLLDRQPGLGENVVINYSSAKGVVRDAHDRAKVQELGR